MEFRDEYNASRNTIRDAIKWLTVRGLVETRPGQGTFVVQRLEPIVTTLSEDPETGMAGGEGKAAFLEIMKRRPQKPEEEPRASVPTIEIKFAPDYVAGRLRIDVGAEVLVRHHFRKTLGLVQCGYRVRILVRSPNEAEARFFGLPDDGRVPVVSLIRTAMRTPPKVLIPSA